MMNIKELRDRMDAINMEIDKIEEGVSYITGTVSTSTTEQKGRKSSRGWKMKDTRNMQGKIIRGLTVIELRAQIAEEVGKGGMDRLLRFLGSDRATLSRFLRDKNRGLKRGMYDRMKMYMEIREEEVEGEKEEKN